MFDDSEKTPETPETPEEDNEDYFGIFLEWLARVEAKIDYVTRHIEIEEASTELKMELRKMNSDEELEEGDDNNPKSS